MEIKIVDNELTPLRAACLASAVGVDAACLRPRAAGPEASVPESRIVGAVTGGRYPASTPQTASFSKQGMHMTPSGAPGAVRPGTRPRWDTA